MRQLRVVGLGEDTTTVILEDPVRHERFTVASDERLRAAARGDIRRLGQMEIEVASPLRPKDIQARVRNGEAVEDVAATAGVSVSHVERFAYPVLLERARVAELAGRAHPLRDDRPDPRVLRDIVSATLSARGQSYDEARWDAWKGEDGRWTVAMSWTAGRSENIAHWAFRPGPSGGLVEPRDDAARDVSGEPPSGPRRADGRAGRVPRSELEPDAQATEEREELEMPARLVAGGAPLRRERSERGSAPAESSSSGATGGSAAGPAASSTPAPAQSPAAGAPARPRPDASSSPRPPGRPAVPPAQTSARSPRRGAGTADSAEGDDAERRRKRHPIVPSWEDVLLGVRSPKG